MPAPLMLAPAMAGGGAAAAGGGSIFAGMGGLAGLGAIGQGLGYGALFGLGKDILFDAPARRRQMRQRAVDQRLSPFLDTPITPAPTVARGSNILQAGITGGMLANNISAAQNSKKLTDARIKMLNNMGSSFQGGDTITNFRDLAAQGEFNSLSSFGGGRRSGRSDFEGLSRV